ncbi:hypothetical protein [Nannocystis punicea]|uniref:Uncharacterized protein n=1 Tax=Nannocystis punicea TaxID=2995304 RepID=A0ABY7H6R2_9BACT|nr:hypothetical protein [Nannocystis poenicansa]WAS94674.1 hypothetical protein O0S08_00805 [Nannocystis poenicansa]
MWRVLVALLLAACGEPGTRAATGPAPVVDPAAEVALLAVVEGTVTVRDAQGVETPGRPELSLRRGDTVITTPGALAVVVLANGYVIKLEDDQSTPVRALAHLDDPPPAESVAELFEKALGAEDFARVGGADRLERIAGWNARRASGETPAPVAKLDDPPAPVKSAEPAKAEEADRAPEQPDAPLTDSKRGIGELDGDGPKADPKSVGKQGRGTTPLPGKKTDDVAGPSDPIAPPPSQKPVDDDEKKASTSKKSSEPPPPSQGVPPPGGAPEPESSSSAADLADSWIFETGPETQVTRTSLPEALKSRRQALAQCVVDALPGVAAPELRLKVAGGVVKEVALGGGKSAPACARVLLNQRLAGVGDGWVIVRVRR